MASSSLTRQHDNWYKLSTEYGGFFEDGWKISSLFPVNKDKSMPSWWGTEPLTVSFICTSTSCCVLSDDWLSFWLDGQHIMGSLSIKPHISGRDFLKSPICGHLLKIWHVHAFSPFVLQLAPEKYRDYFSDERMLFTKWDGDLLKKFKIQLKIVCGCL